MNVIRSYQYPYLPRGRTNNDLVEGKNLYPLGGCTASPDFGVESNSWSVTTWGDTWTLESGFNDPSIREGGYHSLYASEPVYITFWTRLPIIVHKIGLRRRLDGIYEIVREWTVSGSHDNKHWENLASGLYDLPANLATGTWEEVAWLNVSSTTAYNYHRITVPTAWSTHEVYDNTYTSDQNTTPPAFFTFNHMFLDASTLYTVM